MDKHHSLSLELTKRLKSYSLTAGAVAGALSASATVQYTDVDPDFQGTIPDSTAFDIDNDGIADIALWGDSFTSVTASNMLSVYRVFARALGSVGIAGDASVTYSGSFSYYYPYALDQNNMIDRFLNFNSGYSTQTMAWATYSTASSNFYFYGNWNNQADKYLGLRLTINGNIHYGWMRLSIGITDYTVKDYAYEDEPCIRIQAGSQTSMLPDPAATVSNLAASDVNDNDNGTDLQVSFTIGDESTINEYRIFVVKAANASSFDLATAEAVGTSDYTVLAPNGSDVVTTLAANASDVDGDAIVENVEYVVFVMGTETCETSQVPSLSGPSDPVTLEDQLGINGIDRGGLSVWSNGKLLNVEANNQTLVGSDFSIMNTNGQLVHRAKIRDQRTVIELDVPTGIYFLAMNNNGSSVTRKFLIK